jgi:Bacterial capsule synthesis protein PGA_cap
MEPLPVTHRRAGPRRSSALILVVTLLAASCTATPSVAPTEQNRTPSEPTAPAPSSFAPPAAPTSAPTPTPTLAIPLALVADVREPRVELTLDQVQAALDASEVLLPCGISDLSLAGTVQSTDGTACLPADALTDRVHGHPGQLALLPPGLVSARVKVLRVGGADLFGPPSVRALRYPLRAVARDLPPAWTWYDPAAIRTIVSTGDTCPDRGVSLQTVVRDRGWAWALDGGRARYTGVVMDHAFSGPTGNGWPVVEAVRTGGHGLIRALLTDADITVNDFECPMISGFVEHYTGTVFNVDPRVARLLAGAGVDVVTLGSNHITDQGTEGLRQTLAYLDAAGIRHTGAGMDLARALAPAVVNVRGLRFALVG